MWHNDHGHNVFGFLDIMSPLKMSYCLSTLCHLKMLHNVHGHSAHSKYQPLFISFKLFLYLHSYYLRQHFWFLTTVVFDANWNHIHFSFLLEIMQMWVELHHQFVIWPGERFSGNQIYFSGILSIYHKLVTHVQFIWSYYFFNWRLDAFVNMKINLFPVIYQ